MISGRFGTNYQYNRHLAILPTLSTAPSSFRGHRIPRPAGVEPTDQDGLICWGTAGDLPSPEPLPSTDFTVKWPEEEHIEVERGETLVRIENPDAPGQYIMVSRADYLLFLTTKQTPASGSNTSAETPDFGDFSPSEFKPLGTSSPKKGRLRVTLSNGPTSA